METIRVSTTSKQYNVFIGPNVSIEIETFIKKNLPSCTKILLLTDENVANYHLETMLNILDSANFDVVTYKVPSGEQAKTFQIYEDCLTFALEQQLDRKSLLLAFGGGAVGDLGGFVAATYMRGISFIQIPTTILAHDSAVGGKVAINHPSGKNMVGAFYHPEAVFYDLNYLKTLPLNEVRSGFAEVIKHALINDEQFLQQLMNEVSSLSDLNSTTLQNFLTKGIQIKGAIVAEDEREQGVRSFLNFGHTLAHAIEAEVGYGSITHGEAVLIGMLFALEISKEKFNLTFNYNDFKKWVINLGYRVNISEQLNNEKLLNRMYQDKKTVSGKIRFVLLKEVGKPCLIRLDDDYILTKLTEFSMRG